MALCCEHPDRPRATQRSDEPEGPGPGEPVSEPGCSGAGGPRAPSPLTHADSFPFGGDDRHLLVDLDPVLVPEDAWEHDLRAIADGVHLRGGVPGERHGPRRPPPCTPPPPVTEDQ